ncbi:hypothetical protein M0051_01830 [Marinifilum sp. D714]|nr:hypothetical protein [Marinifilum sp. D714]
MNTRRNYLNMKNAIMVVCLVILVLLSIFSLEIAEASFYFVEIYLSPDGYIHTGLLGLNNIIQAYLNICFGLWLGVFVFMYTKLGSRLECIFLPTRVRIFFLGDNYEKNVLTKYHRNLIIASAIIGFPVLMMTHLEKSYLINLLLDEDGFFEYFSFFLLFFSGLILILVFFLRRIKYKLPIGATNTLFAVFSVLILFIAFEEISWGQRIFNVETPMAIKEVNYQSELNLHNIFNLYFPVIYPLSAIVLFTLCLLGWIPRRSYRTPRFQLIFPYPSLFSLAFFLLISSMFGGFEIFEIFFSLFAFFYSLTLYLTYINNLDPKSV